MAKSQSSFRLDRREMTVILSLFIFTSLLMFTVGIVVGKGITQSTPENRQTASASLESEHAGTKAEPSESPAHPVEGTSVSKGHSALSSHDEPSHSEHAKVETSVSPTSHLEAITNQVSEPSTPEHKAPAKKIAKGHEIPESSETPSPHTPELELIPEKPRTGDVRSNLTDLAENKEVETALKNPKIQALLEDTPKSKTPKRAIASPVPHQSIPTTPPKSFPEGKYTVQVGSYPSQADANLRLEQLRTQGFPFAYLSTKELGDTKEAWYRVWLGYFPDANTAKASGELLQQRGEVKSYLVRKSENKND